MVFSAFFSWYELLCLLKFVRFVVSNSHWCTVQWGVWCYEERNNIQMCYEVCFIFKVEGEIVLTVFINPLQDLIVYAFVHE